MDIFSFIWSDCLKASRYLITNLGFHGSHVKAVRWSVGKKWNLLLCPCKIMCRDWEWQQNALACFSTVGACRIELLAMCLKSVFNPPQIALCPQFFKQLLNNRKTKASEVPQRSTEKCSPYEEQARQPETNWIQPNASLGLTEIILTIPFTTFLWFQVEGYNLYLK